MVSSDIKCPFFKLFWELNNGSILFDKWDHDGKGFFLLKKICWPQAAVLIATCYKLVQDFRVTCFFTGQYNTKGYDMTTDVI